MPKNQGTRFPGVRVTGSPRIGKRTKVGFWTEINARHSRITIGEDCDIGSFCAINVADSHKKCIELMDKHEYSPITIENNVFIGSHCMIKGGAYIGHHSVVAAGTVVDSRVIPPYSLVYMGIRYDGVCCTQVKESYYDRVKEVLVGDCAIPLSKFLSKFQGLYEHISPLNDGYIHEEVLPPLAKEQAHNPFENIRRHKENK